MLRLARDGLVECFEIAQGDRQHRKYVASTRPKMSWRNCYFWPNWSDCSRNSSAQKICSFLLYGQIRAMHNVHNVHTCAKHTLHCWTLSIFSQCLPNATGEFSFFDIWKVSFTTGSILRVSCTTVFSRTFFDILRVSGTTGTTLRVSGTTVAEKMALAKQVTEIPKNNLNNSFFRHASVSSTYPCQSVGP